MREIDRKVKRCELAHRAIAGNYARGVIPMNMKQT